MDTPIGAQSVRPHPGRWIGGLVGGVVTVAVTLVADAVTSPQTADNGFLGSDLAGVALGGLPIAILGGRALWPVARSGGWLMALGVGFGFGLIAPPLGALEVVAVGLLPFSGATSGFDDNVLGFLVILPIALVYSYVVVVLTIPAGLAWAVIVRAIPERGLDHLRIGSG